MKRGLIVFVKVPQPGQVKTRLTSVMTPKEAAALYGCFLEDSLRQYRRLSETAGFDVLLWSAPSGSAAYFRDYCNRAGIAGVRMEEQQGKDLGARMAAAFDKGFANGYDQLIVIGTDHPTLPDEFLMQAFENLETCDAVIGPAEDGGYYLLGLRESIPDVFENMPWSTPTVFETTRQRLVNRQTAVLPEWYDVDDAASLERCAREIAVSANPPLRTSAFLNQFYSEVEKAVSL